MLDIRSHTKQLLERFFRKSKPALPTALVAQIRELMDKALADNELSIEELEEVFVQVGKLTWPYRKAFAEVQAIHRDNVGEKLFLSKISGRMKRRYEEFLTQGGSFVDLYTGKHMPFFSLEERPALSRAMIDAHDALSQYVCQQIKGLEQERFARKVQNYEQKLHELEHELAELQDMIRDEDHHDHLTSHVTSRIRGFEHGLCHLGPEISIDDMLRLREDIRGRNHELGVRGYDILRIR